MAEAWKVFEDISYNYLKNTYGNRAHFEAFGKSDSTKPDVYVIPASGEPFYVEVKSKSAQCGQFVLFPNENSGEFEYSPANATPSFDTTRTIMEHMNARYDAFVNAGTAGVPIELDESVFYEWIKAYYRWKGVQFFITCGREFIIFPIEKFEDYFSASCCYRMKKSGSSHPSEKNWDEINRLLLQNEIPGTLQPAGKELYLNSPRNLDGSVLQGERYRYLLRHGANSSYLIRRLSNTCNCNVIFQIRLKKDYQGKEDLSSFIDCIG